MKIDETSYLEIKALVYAIDTCVLEIRDSMSQAYESVVTLSGMLLEKIKNFEEEQK